MTRAAVHAIGISALTPIIVIVVAFTGIFLGWW